MKRSVKVSILTVIFICVFYCGFTMILNDRQTVAKYSQELASNYLSDIANSYGGTIDVALGQGITPEQILSPEGLAGNIGDAKLSGMPSSYAYAVSIDGTMLYHPTADKIGKPVENAVVKDLCARLQAGEKVENAATKYDYNGSSKFAAWYVGQAGDFVVIMTVDGSELLQITKKIMTGGVKGLIIAMVLSMLIGFVVATLIVKPIVTITKVIKKIAKMDLTSDKDLDSLVKKKSEIGDMAIAMVELRSQLIHVIGNLQKQSETLDETAIKLNDSMTQTVNSVEQVGQAMGEIADGATSQADETQNAMNSVVAMGKIVEETNVAVDRLLEYAGKMRDSGASTQKVLEQLVGTNTKAQDCMEDIAKQTKVTNESALKISQAANIITSIADETNLLALNASIESARAGEWGRGFAVVADQIAKLAAQSNESAMHIGEVIDDLLADSRTTMETMDNVKAIMNQQNDDMKRMEEAVVDIRANIDSSINEMNIVSGKSAELNEERKTINSVVESLSAVAEENAAASEETSSSIDNIIGIVGAVTDQSSELQAVVANLESCVNVFTLDLES